MAAGTEGKYGSLITVSPTVTIDTAAYTAGDLLGGKLTLTDAVRVVGSSGIVQSIVLIDQDNEKREIDVVFFDSDPSGTTFTNNAALDVADADMAKIVGTVKITSADYISFADNAVATRSAIGLAFKTDGSRDLYAALVVREAPTYTATTDIALRVTILQD